MTHRIAEFDDSDDALRFAKMKGPDYTVCGGIQRMWAVRPVASYETNFSSDNPPERRSLPYRDGDEE